LTAASNAPPQTYKFVELGDIFHFSPIEIPGEDHFPLTEYHPTTANFLENGSHLIEYIILLVATITKGVDLALPCSYILYGET